MKLLGHRPQTTHPAPVVRPGTAATFVLGAAVSCDGGPCGELSRVVVDVAGHAVTHLVVEPHHRHALGRLVPAPLAQPDDRGVRLACGLDALRDMPYVQENEFIAFDPALLPAADGFPWASQVPYGTVVTHEQVPPGHVEIAAGDRVAVAGGVIGRAHWVVTAPEDRRLIAIGVRRRHLRRAPEVTIPVGVHDRLEQHGGSVQLTQR